jgi:tetratricopeptide (TPR) repeat protein
LRRAAKKLGVVTALAIAITVASDVGAQASCDSRYSAVSWSNVHACTANLQSSRLSNYERAMTLNIRGNNYSSLKQYDLAIADYSKVISLLPDFDYAYANRGMEKCRKGDCRSALADYDKALSINPENDWARYGRGVARFRSDDFVGAKADISTVNSRGWETAAGYRRIGMTPLGVEVIVPLPNLILYWAPVVLLSMLVGSIATLLVVAYLVLRARRRRARSGRAPLSFQ